jgi:hypothetical protein
MAGACNTASSSSSGGSSSSAVREKAMKSNKELILEILCGAAGMTLLGCGL